MIHDFILLNTCIEADVVCAGIVSLIFSGMFFVLLSSWHCFPKLPGNRGVSGSGMVLGCFVGSKDLLASAVGIVACLVIC